jgi:hypothetical protein
MRLLSGGAQSCRYLLYYYRKDLGKLENLLGRNLDRWLVS